MTLMIITTMMAAMIPSAVLFMAWTLSTRSTKDREKSSPFECGFDPMNSARIPFSMRFFLLAIVFIVFDIEIVLLMPIPLMYTKWNMSPTILTASIFLLILIMGLIHEWNEGSLDWSR